MHLRRKLVFAASMALLLLTARAAFAAPADEKDRVLRRLDEAARNFHATSADFQFDSVETDPIYDKDTQRGTVYYKRAGSTFQMAAHINEHNGKPSPKIYGFSGGVFRLFEIGLNQVTTYKKASRFESYVMLGFGASGRELADKWEIKYLGPETLSGVKTEKLELFAKDPAVRKIFPRVTIWVDAERGVSLKQVFDEGPGQYRVCVYFNFKFPQSLPADTFTLKTDKKTTFVNR
jgi:outer membrane lipoprotein-sorting protein